MESLGVVIFAIGVIFYISGRISSSSSIKNFGKGLMIAGVFLFLLFSVIDVRLELQTGSTFTP